MPGYLAFDVETVPDGAFISRVKYPDDGLTPDQAIDRAEKEALESSDGKSDFIALAFHVPVSVAIARLDDDYNVRTIAALGGAEIDIATAFWAAYAAEDVTFVTFNGRAFDLPMMEQAAFRHGLEIPSRYWMKYGPRNRFGDRHIDLMEWIGNSGAHRVTGGLHALANMLGRSGKHGSGAARIDGKAVRSLYAAGRTDAIHDYCARDVLDTLKVFLRTRVMMGHLDLKTELEIMARAEELALSAGPTR